ncbi:TIR domain-containing protein [Tsuneonella mangrovi]|uniref:TIR domain-containing protein n=1 Tax=Tsuneonella mangrovi TaxID=1982042 RepID=UPI0014711A54|nr:TIR domain-containing protein [Tsuneonella mangrovi]
MFVSYARSSSAQARAAAERLRDSGYTVWIDDDLPAHRSFSTVIEENLTAASAVLVLWSEDARASRWVPAEADMAYNADKLVQMSLDGALPPLPFNRVHCEVATGWHGERDAPAWRKIDASIAELVKGKQHRELAPAPTRHATRPLRERMLAVLPFDNLSSDEELTFFCDGVSEEIQRSVADGSDLKVVARSSSFQFRGADKDTAKVAAALGVSHLLDGSVRRGGSRVRISAELVDCTTRSAIWGDRFDGDLEDVFELQDSIAQAVAKALKVALAPKPKERSMPPDLYEEFIRARGWMAEGDAMFDDSATRAVPLLEKVIAGAPDFAPAWELLATARAWELRTGLYEGEYSIGRDSVIHAAHTALELDPRRGGAYASLAKLEPWGSYESREKLLSKALQVSPRDPAILTDMSDFYWSVGRFRDGLALAEQACELNPLMPSAQLHVSQMRLYTGDYEGGIEMNRRIRRRWPDNPGILLSLVNSSSFLDFWDAYDEAVPFIENFSGWQVKDMRAAKAYADAKRSMDPDLIEKRVARYVKLLDDTGTMPLNLILSIAALGKLEFALDLAERANYDYVFDRDGARPSIYYPGTILARWSEPLRSPRITRLCRRLGLADYWVNTDQWPDCVEWVPYDFKEGIRETLAAPA